MEIKGATTDDIKILAKFNKELIEDEKSDNPMDEKQLAGRMGEFLADGYKAYLFIENGQSIGYALVKTDCTPLYLRQFYIARAHRRKKYGSQAFKQLAEELNAGKINVDVLYWNKRGYEFWKSIGFDEISINMQWKSD